MFNLDGDVGALLDAVVAVPEPVRLSVLWRPPTRDPDHHMVLVAAVNGHADGIITVNLHDFENSAGRFGIAVLAPGDAITHRKDLR